MKVYAPNKQYTGTSSSVFFNNGVGETENPYLLNWFRAHGYTVEESEAKKGRASRQKAGE